MPIREEYLTLLRTTRTTGTQIHWQKTISVESLKDFLYEINITYYSSSSMVRVLDLEFQGQIIIVSAAKKNKSQTI